MGGEGERGRYDSPTVVRGVEGSKVGMAGLMVWLD